MHVGDRPFGARQLESDEATILDQVLANSDKVLSSIPAQIVALECYDDYFGINGNSKYGESPYALVALHEPEDVAAVDPYDVYLERYLVANVLKFTGMSFKDFLTLPRDRADAILKRCDAVSSKEDSAIQGLMDGATGGKK
ncbi:hypothetical protein D9M68_19780 [compost metagenome]